MMVVSMHSKITIIWLIFTLSSFLVVSLASVNADDSTQQDASTEKNVIKTGIYAISIGNFEFTKGTYIIDFYLIFKWNNQNLSPSSFELMNGRAVSKEKIYEETINQSSEVWYRIQANLFITPEFKNYPFDSQNLKIIIEDSKYNTSTLIYSTLTDFTGIDDRFTLSGWNIESYNFNVEEHEYPWGEEYSQLVYMLLFLLLFFQVGF